MNRNLTLVIARESSCHCEERSDEAIQSANTVPGLLRHGGPRNDKKKETTMKPLLIICLAALTAAALLPETADARSGARRPRLAIVAPRRFYFKNKPGPVYRYSLKD